MIRSDPGAAGRDGSTPAAVDDRRSFRIAKSKTDSLPTTVAPPYLSTDR